MWGRQGGIEENVLKRKCELNAMIRFGEETEGFGQDMVDQFQTMLIDNLSECFKQFKEQEKSNWINDDLDALSSTASTYSGSTMLYDYSDNQHSDQFEEDARQYYSQPEPSVACEPKDRAKFSPPSKNAVQIVRIGDDGRGYSIHRDELTRVFRQVGNTPVAIYSLAGAFRKGKSFMLNLFLRYLQSSKRAQMSGGWLREKGEELTEGFGWRGGSERMTTGIWIWEEPFYIETATRGEVALFLMDTQGSFDNQTNMKQCSIIFAFSTLISSMQIYNISQQIQEDHLQHLELFCDYGKAASGKTGRSQTKSFQKLMFLIRDWGDSDFDYGINGGKEILARELNITTEHNDLTTVRKSLTDSFEELSCFLMPYPGRNVAVRGKKDGSKLKLNDVDPLFLDLAGCLVRHLFSPEKVTVKKINGKVASGYEVVTFALAYFDVFESGKMPDVTTIWEANARATMETARKKFLDEFRGKLEKICGNKLLSDEKLQRSQLAIKEEVLRSYDMQPKLGANSFISQTSRKSLEKDMDSHVQLVVQQNKVRRYELQDSMRTIVEKAQANYQSKMEELSEGKAVDEHETESIEKKAQKDALAYFNKETRQMPPDIIAEGKKVFQKVLDETYKRFQHENKIKKDKLDNDIKTASRNALGEYRSLMEQNCNDCALTKDKIESLHESAKEKALCVFDSSAGVNDHPLGKTERQELLRQIDIEENRFKQNNKLNEKLQKEKMLEQMNIVKDIYTSAMNEGCGTEYVDVSLIEQNHKKAKLQAKQAIISLREEKGSVFVDGCLVQLDDFLDNALQQIKNKNDARKQERCSSFKNTKRRVYIGYRKELGNPKLPCEKNEDLKCRHTMYRDSALEEFSLSKQEPHNEFEFQKSDLRSMMDDLYTSTRDRNIQNTEGARQKIKTELEKGKNKYMQKMSKTCEKDYVEERDLERDHSGYMRDIISDLKIPDAYFKVEMIDDFKEDLKRQYETYKKLNESHKGFFRKRKENVQSGWSTVKGWFS